jgi:hypothetical protein
MDTQYEYLTPEFLHLLFFEQKNLIVYPYVDIENLRVLKLFITGYKIIEIQSNDLFNIKDVVSLSIEESTDEERPFFLIYNLSKKNIQDLSKVKDFHGILNSNEDLTDLTLIEISDPDFILFNKKRQEFINYEFEDKDLGFEKKIFLEKDKNGSINTIVERIHSKSKEILLHVNQKHSQDKISTILKSYTEDETQKILRYTKRFFKIKKDLLRLEEDTNQNSKHKKITRDPSSLFSEEYEKIISSNKMLSKEFIQLLHDYRMNNVNASNLELDQLYSPQSLYLYLRQHHWKDCIPKDFLKKWLKMDYTQYSLTEQDRMDFELLLNELKIPTKILMDIIKDFKPRDKKDFIPKLSSDTPVNPSKKKIKKKTSEAIPPVKEFETFQSWILQKLDDLERGFD